MHELPRGNAYRHASSCSSLNLPIRLRQHIMFFPFFKCPSHSPETGSPSLFIIVWSCSSEARSLKKTTHGGNISKAISLKSINAIHRDCPKCKKKVRATKTLSLARLPPVLLIHLKRFQANGVFSDKIDTHVDFPMKSLDLTQFIPTASSPNVQPNSGLPYSSEDPRTQNAPFRYDLYGVTNHYGNLSSGHCTFTNFLLSLS